MKMLSDSACDPSAMREKLLGAGLETMRKSYYPALQNQLRQLRESERSLQEQSLALLKTVNELEQARHEIEKREARFRVLIETAPVVILVLDLQGRILEFNPQAERTYSCPRQEMLGENYFDLFLPEHEREPVMAECQRIIAGETARGYENAIKASDGGRRFFAWNADRLLDEQGQVIGIIAIGQDITKRKEAEEKVLQLNQELEQRVALRTRELERANAELDAFNSMVSHDLQGPLRRIYSYSKLLQESAAGELSTENQDYANRIVEGVGKMSSLIRGLLAFSRAARVELTREPIDLGELVGEIREELLMDYPESNFSWDIKPLPIVEGDHALLRQVLVNLISNALKYSKTRAEPRVEIGMRASTSDYAIYVSDNGVGFDSQYVGRLFKPFERLHSEHEFSGNGIGLAIVARIIARHGGRVWAEGSPEQGACFYFTLPKREHAALCV